MGKASAISISLANSPASKVGRSLPHSGATNFAIINKIRSIYSEQTVPALAAWIKVTLKTARNRLEGERHFTLDELADLLDSEHGFEILSAIMHRARTDNRRLPTWWRICEPLMGIADSQRMQAAIRKRVNAAIEGIDDADAQLEADIRRAEAMAIHGSGPARAHADALRSHRRFLAKG